MSKDTGIEPPTESEAIKAKIAVVDMNLEVVSSLSKNQARLAEIKEEGSALSEQKLEIATRLNINKRKLESTLAKLTENEKVLKSREKQLATFKATLQAETSFAQDIDKGLSGVVGSFVGSLKALQSNLDVITLSEQEIAKLKADIKASRAVYDKLIATINKDNVELKERDALLAENRTSTDQLSKTLMADRAKVEKFLADSISRRTPEELRAALYAKLGTLRLDLERAESEAWRRARDAREKTERELIDKVKAADAKRALNRDIIKTGERRRAKIFEIKRAETRRLAERTSLAAKEAEAKESEIIQLCDLIDPDKSKLIETKKRLSLVTIDRTKQLLVASKVRGVEFIKLFTQEEEKRTKILLKVAVEARSAAAGAERAQAASPSGSLGAGSPRADARSLG